MTQQPAGSDSCLSLLIVACGVQIERDTFGMLQCHPYPYEYTDTSKQCAHCAFFMGLQRKQGVKVNEGQQFDIRGTVDEFRQDINMYMYWKPGMDMFVSHVRRKQLPSYVFPEGYKRSRRHTGQQVEKICDEAEGDTGITDRPLKRRTDSEMGDMTPSRLEKKASISPQRLETLSPEFSSRFYTPSPLSSGELVKPSHTPDLLTHPEEMRSFGQINSDQKSQEMLVDKTNHQVDIADNTENEASTMKSLPRDVSGQETLASYDICNRIKDSCHVRKDEEISSFQTDSFRRAKDLIEKAAKDEIDEVMAHHEKSEGVENGIHFSSASVPTTSSCEVSYFVMKTF